ncbi:hypothetical protein [Chitinophaga barathri]|uniref:t-SNARE coiled-coil homology domain-containing protein n=1 Tax=Chitinophaga barathri TaxID=1647451 RepID=A0A3N4MHT5_9BACT|nr:hypothetical protein [Chitinophaga barathri]RPD43168.1 hypothetical protein EG028_02405 [Chitinophaga barathri]
MDNKDVLIQFEALRESIVNMETNVNKRLDSLEGINSRVVERLDGISVRLDGMDVRFDIRLSNIEARLDNIEEDINVISKWVPFRSPIPDFSTPLKK